MQENETHPLVSAGWFSSCFTQGGRLTSKSSNNTVRAMAGVLQFGGTHVDPRHHPTELAERRVRMAVGLKRYFHAKRLEGLLSSRVRAVPASLGGDMRSYACHACVQQAQWCTAGAPLGQRFISSPGRAGWRWAGCTGNRHAVLYGWTGGRACMSRRRSRQANESAVQQACS